MARGHGRILTSIWEDADFLALDEQQQRLYLFLISQPNLNHAGLLDLTLRRWARKANGLSVADLEERIAALAKARFIVVDDGTEELLIRSFVRNDGVWRMPKVMGAMVSGALEISSPLLRRALLDEMDRVPLNELSDEPTKTARGVGPSIRSQVEGHIEALRKAFGNPTPDPTQGGSRTPSGTPSGTPSDTPDGGGPKGSTRGRAGAHVRAAPALSPSPAPTPAPEERGAGEPSGQSAAAASAETARPEGRDSLQPLPDDFALNDGMRVWAQNTFPRVDVDHETQKFVLHWRGEAARRRNWYTAWQKWITDANQHLLKHGAAQSNVIALASGQPLPGTDTTVAGWDAIAADLRAKENPA